MKKRQLFTTTTCIIILTFLASTINVGGLTGLAVDIDTQRYASQLNEGKERYYKIDPQLETLPSCIMGMPCRTHDDCNKYNNHQTNWYCTTCEVPKIKILSKGCQTNSRTNIQIKPPSIFQRVMGRIFNR
jgi:hypothetical protein